MCAISCAAAGVDEVGLGPSEGIQIDSGSLSDLLRDLDNDSPVAIHMPRRVCPVFSPESSATDYGSDSSDDVFILCAMCYSWSDAFQRLCPQGQPTIVAFPILHRLNVHVEIGNCFIVHFWFSITAIEL